MTGEANEQGKEREGGKVDHGEKETEGCSRF